MELVALGAVLAVYLFAKVVSIVRGPAPHGGSLALFLTIWPGMWTTPFASRVVDLGARRLIKHGSAVFALGVVGWTLLIDLRPHLSDAIVGWLGIAVILTTFHLGISDVITGGLRLGGYPVRRLFADPLLSRTLREFWSRRWNVAFVEMNQVVFLPWLRIVLGRNAFAGAFVLSGLLHELAISLPVWSGFGLPTLYFCLQAFATAVESRLGIARWPAALARLWTFAWLLIPLPLLFHQAFRDALVLPLFGGK